MLEVSVIEPTIVRCFGSPDALDRLGVHHDALTVRIAPDELLVVHVVHVVATVQGLDEIEAELGQLDPSSFAIDQSSAFAVFALSGSVDEALARLTAIPVPANGSFQGRIADVAGKLIRTDSDAYLLVGSTYRHYVSERICTSCADIGVEERPSLLLTGVNAPGRAL